ncbi:ankyrin repeat-containing domain protein [Mycena rebaudengoi]|nr:ankyrin repeat-containing domain protein [Mycena rebaudengoi]
MSGPPNPGLKGGISGPGLSQRSTSPSALPAPRNASSTLSELDTAYPKGDTALEGPSAAVNSSPTSLAPAVFIAAVPSSVETALTAVNPKNAKDSVVHDVTIALDVAAQLASYAHALPLVAPIAGFLSLILKTYQEAKDTDDKRDALLFRCAGIGQDLCAAIHTLKATNHVDLIGRLNTDIERYSRLLEHVLRLTADYNTLGAIQRGVDRKQLGSRFTELQRDLDSFGARFRNNRLVDLAIQQSMIKSTLDKVDEMNLEKKLEDWLQDQPNTQQRQHETQKLRKAGTGRWFLEGSAFVEWQDNPGLLWILGALGTGKSVLSSSVIQKLIEDQQLFLDLGKSSAVAFFYFDFKAKDENAVETALRRMLLQLSAQAPAPYNSLNQEYHLSRGQALPNYQVLLRLLRELLRELGRTYIILDALDECPGTEFRRLMALISELRAWKSSPLHVMLTSQPRTRFTEEMGDIPCVVLDANVTQPDIELFIASELRNNPKMKPWAHRTEEITHRVADKSRGMFRLADCLLLELSRCKRQSELEPTLENLPNELFGICDRFLEAIRPQDLVYAIGALRWLLFSAQNLTLVELADAIAFDFSNPTRYKFDPSLREDNINAIPVWLEGLATVVDGDGGKSVLFGHGSVQDYLFSGRIADKFGFDLSPGHSHAFIARSCLGQLLYFSDHPLGSPPHHPSSPLAPYAAKWWCHHLRRSSERDQSLMASDAMLLLEDGSEQYRALKYLRRRSYTLYPRPDPDSPLHLCSEEGYIEGVRQLLQNGVDVNVQNTEATALQAASVCGHREIVHLLLEKGAEVNAKGRQCVTSALELACTENLTDIVRLLLASGADVSLNPNFLGTALQAASWAGNKEVVALLLANGADVNAHGRYVGSAFQAASSNGNAEIIRLLLQSSAALDRRAMDYGCALATASLIAPSANVDIKALEKSFGTRSQASLFRVYDDAARSLLARGVDLRRADEYHGSALQAACMNGHTEIIHFLLENGADVNAQDASYPTALDIASSKGDLEVVRIILQNGADVNAKTRYGSALGSAAKNGHADIINLLLKNHADVGTALHEASREGHLEIIRLLLDHGADVNTNSVHGTALHSASSGGQMEAVRLLIAEGGDVNSIADGNFRGRPLHMACEKGHIEVIELLLENGADVNAADSWQGPPLHAAACSGNIDIFRLLIQKGAEVNASCEAGKSFANALQAASFYGHTDIIRLLLDHGADINAQGGGYHTALQAAIYLGNKSSRDTVDFLLANGADVNAQGGTYESALLLACKRGAADVIQLLVTNGADVNARGGNYGNVLGAACRSRNEETVRILLAHDVDLGDTVDSYALQIASKYGYPQISGRLLATQEIDKNL